MKLKDIKVTDLKEEGKYAFIFPVGATEQHGPFLPFGTDTYITDWLIGEIEKKFPDLVILPTLEYSRSKEHSGFYGTLWLKDETLLAVIHNVCKSICKQASAIFLTSFHANETVFNKFIELYQKDFPDTKIVNMEVADPKIIKQMEDMIGGPLDDHAGNTEISNMLVVNEKLVTKPPKDYPKQTITNPFEFNDLRKKSTDGIADNHPDWIIDEKIGEKILGLFKEKMSSTLDKYRC